MVLSHVFKKNAFFVGHSGHDSYITCVASHAQFVYTGSNDATIRKWDMATCECVYVFRWERALQ